MEYNTQLNKLMIPEYGRNVQRMAELAVEEPDREKRTKMAGAIIEIMTILNPHQKDAEDFRHKLWDHLHIMTGYKLDVDGPYAAPSRENVESKPRRVAYPKGNIRFMHYGSAVEKFIRKALEMEDEEKRMVYAEAIANLMKKDYLAWNRDAVSDETILAHLEKMSEGKIRFDMNKRLNFIDFRTRNVTNGNVQGHVQQFGGQKKFPSKNNRNHRRKY